MTLNEMNERLTTSEIKKFVAIADLKKAYALGKTIQFRLDGKGWTDWENPKFDCELENYRIKPTYRSFNDCDELIATWQKMMGYPEKANTMPLIWVKSKISDNVIYCITAFTSTREVIICSKIVSLDILMEQFTFLDGSPFGVAEMTERCPTTGKVCYSEREAHNKLSWFRKYGGRNLALDETVQKRERKMKIDNTHGTFYCKNYSKICRLMNFCDDRFIDSEEAKDRIGEVIRICGKIFGKIEREEKEFAKKGVNLCRI